MKIYTRRGDEGETDLLGGGRVSKDDAHVEACGTLDELNSALGMVIAWNESGFADVIALKETLQRIQSDLFQLGSQLALAPGASDTVRMRVGSLSPDRVAALEQLIDRYEGELPPLKNFILPGGSELAARFHLARAVCRRAERRVVTCLRGTKEEVAVSSYLNRLSDLLFVLGRWANMQAGREDVVWGGTADGKTG